MASLRTAAASCAAVSAFAIVPHRDLTQIVMSSNTIVVGVAAAAQSTGAEDVVLPGNRRYVATVVTSDVIVARYLRGSGAPTLRVAIDVPDADLGFHTLPVGVSQVFFLNCAAARCVPTSPYYPSVPGDIAAPTAGESTLDAVAAAIGASVDRASSPTEMSRIVYALGDIRTPRALIELRKALNAPNDDVRATAAARLIESGDLTGLPLAEEMLAAPPQSVTTGTMIALRASVAFLGDAAAIPAMARLAKARDPETRRAAVAGLVNSDSPLAIAHLVDALSDEDAVVRYRACSGLAKITGQRLRQMSPDEFHAREAETIAYWRSWARAQGLIK